MLGVVCLVGGIFFFWDTVTRWANRKERRTRRIITLNFAFIGMTLWLLRQASSATSSVCLLIGCTVIAAAHSKLFRRHPGLLKVLIPGLICLYLFLVFGFGAMGQMASAVGRDPTLTDRTKIWSVLLSFHTNPIIGTGYESFWLGPRLKIIWQSVGLINEAHNGYLDIYLNLGSIGLALLAGFLIASYRRICKILNPSSKIASLSLAIWTVLLFYNVTEAAFKGGLLWMALLPGVIVLPGLTKAHVPDVPAFENASVANRIRTIPSERARLQS